MIRRGLWEERSLVKTWAMRGTLHLLAPADLALYKAALLERSARNQELLFSRLGVNPAELESITERVVEALSGGECLTRKELAARTGEARLVAGWGTFLKPASNRGLIVFGPPRGPETTFVRADAWLGPQAGWGREEAQQQLLRRYLTAFGPATLADFARWTGAASGWARPIWAALLPELAHVEVEGMAAWALATDIAALEGAGESRQLRLLAGFDSWLLGHADRSLIFAREHAPRISRTAGWISAVVAVGGRAVGVWSHRTGNRSVAVQVDLFERLDRDLQRQLKAEVAALESFFGLPCRLAA